MCQIALGGEEVNREMRSRMQMVGWGAGKAKRDPSLHRPTRSQEANAEEKASACFAQDDGAAQASACFAQDDGVAWWLRVTGGLVAHDDDARSGKDAIRRGDQLGDAFQGADGGMVGGESQ